MNRILVFLGAFCALYSYAQLKTSETHVNMGNLAWHTPKTQTITFQNKNRKAVLISDVRTDCGCTAVQWQRDQLLEPGERFTLYVTYDAQTLGRFQKAIRIYTQEPNGERETEVWIKGQVLDNIIDYSQKFPVEMGRDIHVNKRLIEFDDVHRGEHPKQTMQIVNGSRQAYTPSLMHLPAWLTATCEPSVLRPGHSGIITFTANGDHVMQYGLTQTAVYLSRYMGDRVGHENEIRLNMTLVPPLVTDPQALANAPRMEVDSVVRLTERGARNARRLSGTLLIRNSGASELQIKRIQIYNMGLQVRLNRSTIKPGQTATLRVSGWATDANQSNVEERRRILLVTNDPQHPTLTVNVE